ncbi:MAG: carboxypeptidase regulatory-like domain-containing protein [Sedimentisphaerales bacterium]
MPERQPEPLLGKKLPEPDNIQNIDSLKQAEGKRILACFWDMNQRPSRNSIEELAKREKELAGKNVAVLLVDTSDIEPAKLKKWLDGHNIPFLCGSVKDNVDDVLLRWGVQAQPWLILTDQESIVRAEGFSLEQLDEKLQREVSDLTFEDADKTIPTEQKSTNQRTITGVVRDERGEPLEGVKLMLLGSLHLQPFTSDDEGEFEIRWTSQQWGPRGFPHYIEARHQQLNLAGIVEIDENVGTLDIKLKPAVVLFGKVVDPEGRGIAGARTTPVLIDRSVGIETGCPQRRTDSHGNFEIKAIPAGYAYWVLARADGYQDESSLPVQTDSNASNRHFDVGIITLPTGIFYVSGIVVDANDKAVADASVSIDGKGQKHQQKRTDVQGKFTFEKLCAGRIQINAKTNGTMPLKGGVDIYAGASDVKIVVNEQEINKASEKAEGKEPGPDKKPKTGKLAADQVQVVKVDLSVVEVTPGSEMNKETAAKIENILGNKIAIPDSFTVADLLRNASEATGAVEDESAGDKRVTQQQFKTLVDLLVSRGYLKILMNPALEVVEGHTAQIKTDQNSLEVHVSEVKDNLIFLRVIGDLSSQVVPEGEGQAPIITGRNFASTICLSPDQSVIVGGMVSPAKPANSNAKSSQTPAREIVCILTASIVAPAGNAKQQEKATVDKEYEVIQLNHVGATEAAERVTKALQEMLGAEFQKGIFIIQPIENTGQIVIFGRKDLREIAKKLLAQLDTPNSLPETKDEYEVIQLKYVGAEEAAKRINEALQEMSGAEFQKGLFIVQPIENTGQIIIFGRKDVREIVKKLLAQLDIPNGLFETRAFRLKYADPDLIKERIESSYEHAANEHRETVRVISYPTMKQVVVIASPENLSRIAEQIAEWDVFQAVKPRMVDLQNSNPVQMAKLLTALFAEEGGEGVSVSDLIFGEGAEERYGLAGPLSPHFEFEDVPGTNRILVMSNISGAYQAVVQWINEIDKQKMATKDARQVREWMAGLVREGRLRGPETTDKTEQPADNKVTISGQCRDSSGHPLPNAQVLVYCVDYNRRTMKQIAEGRTDSEGRFSLGSVAPLSEEDHGRRRYLVFVPADGHGPAWKEVNLYRETVERLELRAYNSAVVTGTVVTEDSKPVADAQVWVRGIISGPATEETLWADNHFFFIRQPLPGWSATTDSDGSFHISGVPEGTRIQLSVSHRSFAECIVHVKPAAPAKIEVQPGATITGRVLYGATGKPAAGVMVQAQGVEHIPTAGGWMAGWAETVTDEQGRYRLESLCGAKYNVWAEAENLTVVALDSFEATAGQTEAAPDLVLVEGGFIVGRVIDEATGKPIKPGEYSDVAIYGPSRPKSGAAVETSDIRDDGSFRIRVAPGRNYIYLRAMGEWGRDKAIASSRNHWVNVAEGQTVEVEFKIRKFTHEELEVQAKRRQKETMKYISPKTLDEVEQNGKETKEPPADDRTAKEMIEHIIDVNLPKSARNCKYHSVSLELGVVFCYGYFEIHRTDFLSLMDMSEKLPDASELGQNPFAIRQVEKALELSSEPMAWWKPLSLDNRQYGNKVIFSSPSALGGYVGLAICTGEIRDDLMGVYLVYQAD